MSDQNPMINLGDISKPATVLIEKISEAVGGLLKPRQIVRLANAEAEADRIRAVSQIEVTELQQRAVHRLVIEEARHQSIMERIATESLPLLANDADPEKLDDDWITNFFENCRNVSDSKMQNLWSRLLAFEANLPGTFSRKTVNLLADLDKRDAEQFIALCRFRCRLQGENLPTVHVPIVLATAGSMYKDAGLIGSALVNLDELGLINLRQGANVPMGCLPKIIQLTYFDQVADLTLGKDSGNSLDLGRVTFTKAGSELAALCNSQQVDGFVDYLLEKLKKSYTSASRRET